MLTRWESIYAAASLAKEEMLASTSSCVALCILIADILRNSTGRHISSSFLIFVLN